MKYDDGTTVGLGDIVAIPMPDGTPHARVVMLGDTLSHLDIDPSFREWVIREHLLAEHQVVVEWMAENPLARTDPQYAPVGNYLTTGLTDCFRVKA